MTPDDPPVPAQPDPQRPLPARNLSTTELEAVIRRAVELQAGPSALGDDGVSETDVVRIGQELGLDAAVVRRAMAELRARPPEERGALAGLVGERTVRASRVVRRPAAETARLLDRHLRESELMLPQRRQPERTRYVRDESIAAGISRFARGFSRAHQPLKLKQLDVAVSPIDAESCLVEVSVDLATVRGGLVAGVFGSSSVLAGGWTAVVWASPIADPLMLLGIPVLAGSWFGMRAIYRAVARSSGDKLELLLDKLEHGEM